jgi:hypothetical protein
MKPSRNTVGTFFGYILNFPTYFLIRKSPGYAGLNTTLAPVSEEDQQGGIGGCAGLEGLGTGIIERQEQDMKRGPNRDFVLG